MEIFVVRIFCCTPGTQEGDYECRQVLSLEEIWMLQYLFIVTLFCFSGRKRMNEWVSQHSPGICGG